MLSCEGETKRKKPYKRIRKKTKVNKSDLVNLEKLEKILQLRKNQYLSCEQIKELYRNENPSVNFSTTTMRNILIKKLKFSFRRPKFKTPKAITIINMRQRKIFLSKVIEILLSGAVIIFIDESSFGNNRPRFKNWINKNDNEERYWPGRIDSTNIIVASTHNKVISYEIRHKTTKSEDFLGFLENLHKKIKEDEDLSSLQKSNNLWFYFDNASIQKTNKIKDFIRTNGLNNLIYSVPYRPEYNLVEKIFSYIKLRYYKFIASNS